MNSVLAWIPKHNRYIKQASFLFISLKGSSFQRKDVKIDGRCYNTKWNHCPGKRAAGSYLMLVVVVWCFRKTTLIVFAAIKYFAQCFFLVQPFLSLTPQHPLTRYYYQGYFRYQIFLVKLLLSWFQLKHIIWRMLEKLDTLLD